MMLTIRRFRRDTPEIPRARRFVEEVIGRNGGTPSDAVLLVTSELVTNAVRYGAGEVELRLELDDDCVRLEVLDDGHVAVTASDHPPEPTALGGRGLLLVREASRRWGAGFDAAGRTLVWAELPALA